MNTKTIKPSKNKSQTKDWEDGKLGQDEEFVQVSSPEREKKIDEAHGLKMISIRLQEDLIIKLKFIADYHGIGYQPLMRDLLNRFAGSEIQQIAQQMARDAEAEKQLGLVDYLSAKQA